MITFIAFCIVIIIQIYYYFFLFGKFSFLKPIHKSYQKLDVSVIICAKNEANNLRSFLPLIAQQNYFDFEIVLVDDGSTDSSLEIIQNFKNKYESDHLSIQIITISRGKNKGKKAALSKGILASKNEYLVLTDADCKPISTDWLHEITAPFNKDKSIVLGYGAYRKIRNSFLNKIIRFETLLTAIQYFSYAQNGKPYMGVGRNIAYKKEVFIKSWWLQRSFKHQIW